MTDTTRDAFEAWHNEMEVFATRYERLDELVPKEALFAAWQVGTLAAQRQPLTCVWTDQDDDDMPGTYASACGEMWSFTDGGVTDNNVRFCQGCGKAVEVHGITATPQGNQS